MNIGLKLVLYFIFIVLVSRPTPVPRKFTQHETKTQRESLKIHALSEIGKKTITKTKNTFS